MRLQCHNCISASFFDRNNPNKAQYGLFLSNFCKIFLALMNAKEKTMCKDDQAGLSEEGKIIEALFSSHKSKHSKEREGNATFYYKLS